MTRKDSQNQFEGGFFADLQPSFALSESLLAHRSYSCSVSAAIPQISSSLAKSTKSVRALYQVLFLKQQNKATPTKLNLHYS